MIKKERLEELIEQGATIYDKYANALILFNFEQKDDVGFYSQKTHIKNGHLVFEHIGDYDYHFEYCLEDLFETKEDAEEYAEFGNITRTEKLDLPSWEEMKDKLNKEEFVEKYYFYSKHFYKANRDTINIDYTYSIYLMPNGLVIIDDNEKPKTLFSKPLTRENYNEARRLCVKLFKGEEV